ncbi:major facilitator superfamily domain-containing protein [Gilbertella persicaria]|uniref:major facilitator superfamily domain-containing protein n=1 Tax=Gilbertella persicaria TaxID=101096 RepID=UPI00221FCC70|nr:major facilitator superfamily domain-containing protein [Gilbertella persicaria]KAI8080746.1 major facilitator superfamily domain-containing protein [Gilbertella persicaria]
MKESIDLGMTETEIIEENVLTANNDTKIHMDQNILTEKASKDNQCDSLSITTAADHANNTAVDSSLHETKRTSNWYKRLFGDIYATDDPYDYSEGKKNFIILLVALSGIAGPMSSMMYMPALLTVVRDLHTTTSAVNGSVSAFVVFMGISPLFWAALSDTYGRKRMYMFSGMITVVSSVISALSTNIGMLIAFRALQSFGSNAGTSLGAGVIADMIPVENRGKAYGIFYAGPLLGPVIGPTIGGFLCQYLGWRSTFYFTAILCGVLLCLTSVFLPETLRKVKPRPNNNEKNNLEDAVSLTSTTVHPSPNQHLSVRETLALSFKPMITMLHDPNVIILTINSSIIFASLYILNPTITQTFKRIYGYNEWQTGLCYLSLGGGFMVGSIISGRHSDHILKKLSKKRGDGQKIVSEMRLQAAFPSFLSMPAGYLIYGWTTEKDTGIYAPIIGLFLYALGQMWAFTPTSVYLVDTKPGYSATAVGVNACIRGIAAAITTVFSSTAVDALGNGIMFTILGVVGFLNGGLVLLCYFRGTQWRRRFEQKHMPDLYILNNPQLFDSTDVKPMDDPKLQQNINQLEKIHTQHSTCIA